MGRPRLHADDTVLDATRDLVLAGGGGATTAALSTRSAVPVGSLYHRFGSRDALLAELWLRTVKRFQAGLFAAATAAPPGLDRAVAAAAWTVDFATDQPADARLLLLTRREELVRDASLPATVRAALEDLNEPVIRMLRQLAAEIFGHADRGTVEVVVIAVVDLPYAHVRRHLLAGGDAGRHRPALLRVVRHTLEEARADEVP